MHTRIGLTLATLAVFTSAQADPATNQLRIYSVIDEAATITLDNSATTPLPASAIAYFTVAPGPHSLHVVTQSGFDAVANVELKTEDLAQLRGQDRWCIILGSENGQPLMKQPKKRLCQKLLDAAPPDEK